MALTDLGTGTSIAFGTTGFSAEVTAIDISGITRVSVDTTHLGTSNDMTFIAGDLVDNGEIGLELHFDPNSDVPIDQPVEVVTITFPLQGAQVTAANWAMSAFATANDVAVPLEDKMTQTVTLKVTGGINKTDAV